MSATSIGPAQVLGFCSIGAENSAPALAGARIRRFLSHGSCGLLQRSKSQRGIAAGRCSGARIDVGDIDRTSAGAGICSISAESSAPALAGTRIR
jgi:hypothetical protein